MMMTISRAACFAVLLAVVPTSAPAAEPELPVREGLEFWFDAAQVEFPTGEIPAEGVELATWPDSSGRDRDATQQNSAARPRLIQVEKNRIVRFDGDNDHFRVTGVDASIDSATVFLVAAPHANRGAFQAFLALNAKGGNDFQTSVTIDMGPSFTPALSWINVEGRGFQGAQNLARSVSPFGSVHVIETSIRAAEKKVTLTLDGKQEGSRPYEPGTLSLDELTLGARFYSLGAPPEVRGHLAGDIAEVLVYSRDLSQEETEQIREYLDKKHADLRESLGATIAAAGGKPLESIADPPPVQMFVPGFTARELPVKLPNINNVRYRPDGALVALAYDGDVYLLTDSDEDGLEDKVEQFWDNNGRIRSPIGMALTPPGYAKGEGLFVATKSECILIADTDGDRRADADITVAKGWAESFHNVDALGVAVDPKDGSVYFGLGTANFADPWLRNKDKGDEPAYRLDGERGTIMRVSPDFSKREVVCTGIRFPVSLGFNREGDLFCTDQEGATWVPNGNPFDELVHIQKGRHYGFPPRHPKLLPDVTDEPNTYDYMPQHQSTCGLMFNEPAVEGGPSWGPSFWESDALVCGYSRGKLYRTKLAKTPAGYVADNRLLGSLDMLTVDSCVTPAGDLVVAVHSGGPDWGSGPGGEGKLYKVAYSDREAPQPVAVWASGPDEVRIAFDRPLDPEKLRGLAADTEITYGDAVRAGDEFELLRPGYEVVGRQVGSPRHDLKVHSAQIPPDRRTLILSTDPHPEATWYAVRLPGLGRPSLEESASGGALPQHPRIDVDYSLGGVEAAWKGAEGDWSGWLPHVDLAASRTFTAGSADHEALWALLEKAGELRLKTQIDLSHMLRARVQPGSELGYEMTPEHVTVAFRSSHPFRLSGPTVEIEAKRESEGYAARFEQETTSASEPIPIELVLATGKGSPELNVAWHTAESDLPRPLATVRLSLPWARHTAEPTTTLAERVIPELEGGSWARGRAVFFSDAAACAKCHAVHGEGGNIGPDLSNLVHRDYASVHRDVTNPSYAVNPDYIAHAIVLKDGRVLNGTLRGDAERLLVSDTQAKVLEIDRDEIEEIAPSTKSIMPDGLEKLIGAERMRDLLTFLLKRPPHMPLDSGLEPPQPRSREEVRNVLAGAPEPPAATRPINVVLVAGTKDHGPGEHDYPAWQTVWKELLSADDATKVATAWEWPSAEQLAAADVLVFYQKGDWTPQRAKEIDAFLARGAGLVYIHYAVDGGKDAPGFAQRIGLAWGGPGMRFRHGPLELSFETGAGHPIGRNYSTLKLVDESYWNLVGNPGEVSLLASGVEDGARRPLFWTHEPGKGRVFVSIPGHFSWSFDDPLFRVLLLRGIAWTAKEPVDRFNELVLPGARVAD